jgi:hypothetical protein
VEGLEVLVLAHEPAERARPPLGEHVRPLEVGGRQTQLRKPARLRVQRRPAAGRGDKVDERAAVRVDEGAAGRRRGRERAVARQRPEVRSEAAAAQGRAAGEGMAGWWRPGGVRRWAVAMDARGRLQAARVHERAGFVKLFFFFLRSVNGSGARHVGALPLPPARRYLLVAGRHRSP